MTLYSLPTFVTVLLSLGLGLFILARNVRSKLNRTFSSWCFLTAYWQTCWTFLFNVRDPEVADFLARLGYSGIIFIPIVFFHFVVEFANAENKRLLSRLFYLVGAIFLVAVWGGLSFVAGVYQYSWGFYPRAGELHIVYLVFLMLMLLLGLVILLQFRAQSKDQPSRLNQINYILSSTVIYSLAGVDFLANYGYSFYPLGLVFTNIHACIITYAVIQYRLLDVNVAIRRSLIYALILLALLLPCYLMLIKAQTYAFGQISYSFSLMTLSLLIIVGFLFPKFRFRTEEALERVLFKNRKTDYRETLLRSSREMVSIVDLDQLSNNLVRTVVRALGTEKTSLYLLEEAKGVYRLKTRLGIDKEPEEENSLLRNDPVVRHLGRRQEGIVKEELEMVRDENGAREIADRMEQLEAEISVPIISKHKLIGILNLGHKEKKAIYSNEDLELLSTLANQAAIAIENARLYENLKQSQITLRRADRLSSLGLLTAGLAHEIRNPLVAIRTFTQLLPERYDDAEFREGFQGLALKEVDRICGLINDLLSFARPSRPNVAEENMNDVVDGITRILESEAKEKNVEIARDFGASLPKVWIDREQMKQVFMNLILNAIQAMKEGGSISIQTRPHAKSQSGQPGQFVQVEVRDTGMGIPEENLDHIFDPFFTNKDEGSGLGLSISHQIVQEHGGYITVESKIGAGTSFFINVPIGKPARPPMNDQSAAANEESYSHR